MFDTACIIQDFLLLLSVITSDLLIKRRDIKVGLKEVVLFIHPNDCPITFQAARHTGKMLSKSEKSLATVQLFLYTKYLMRIDEFRYIFK